LYRSIKPNFLNLSEPSTEQPSSTDRRSKGTRRSIDLDSEHQLSEAKKLIAELEATVASLKLKLEQMMDINKKLLSEKISASAGESQSMFQQLLLTDLNGEVDHLKSDYSSLREQNEELRQRLEPMIKDKQSLVRQVRRYKDMLADRQTQEHWLEPAATAEALGPRQITLNDKVPSEQFQTHVRHK
jgi:chromosome segregation ATPase